MSYVDMGFCPGHEFESGKADRVLPEDLVLGGLYVTMLALRQNHKHTSCGVKTAAKKMCVVTDVGQPTADFTVVEFSILDDELFAEWDTEGKFKNGFWMDAVQQLTIGGIAVVNGYFKDYADPFDLEIERFFATQRIPSLSEA